MTVPLPGGLPGRASGNGGRPRGSNDAVLVATGASERPEPYLQALRSVGFAAERLRVLMPSPETNRQARRLAAQAAGLVLCGGVDIHPRYFGEEILPQARVTLDDARDELELELLAGAREARTPVLGVCRGLQVINVFLGGTLWQDLPLQVAGSLLHHQSHPPDALIHPIRVASAATVLGELLARELALVNSRHHQGIRRLAVDLTAVGRAPDGLVEAISFHDPSWWLHAVQWHPENLLPMAQGRALWQRFAAAVDTVERV